MSLRFIGSILHRSKTVVSCRTSSAAILHTRYISYSKCTLSQQQQTQQQQRQNEYKVEGNGAYVHVHKMQHKYPFGVKKDEVRMQELFDKKDYSSVLAQINRRVTEITHNILHLAIQSVLEMKNDFVQKCQSNQLLEDDVKMIDAKIKTNTYLVLTRCLQKKFPAKDIVNFLQGMDVPKDIDFFKPLFVDIEPFHIVQLNTIMQDYGVPIVAGSHEHAAILESYILTNNIQYAIDQLDKLTASEISPKLMEIMVSSFIEVGRIDDARRTLYRHIDNVDQPHFIFSSIRLCLALGQVELATNMLINSKHQVEVMPLRTIQDVLMTCRKYREYGLAERIFGAMSTEQNYELMLCWMINVCLESPSKQQKYKELLLSLRQSMDVAKKSVAPPNMVNLHKNVDYMKQRLMDPANRVKVSVSTSNAKHERPDRTGGYPAHQPRHQSHQSHQPHQRQHNFQQSSVNNHSIKSKASTMVEKSS
ncbi:hypothetical protein SAMD00019534_013290 [Acytostelium subglobosum LB1]|uniref:hypothetical protein n=1 Tax=Acytostelium subglobosum LB1 TaxID=1410327 RepID=UPI000644BCB9|nr:hypothetical protein SAMD00019534_013290 [Acytostelium subglobosum LB1]GAM18154.1 hypothetical protein SAMD00019534_013290 [Acytostelium subglobosum LB1]|eukprot:XP_012758750.1 hypothetical protein SAMD00019534_013290 [Acytostelium subglobosum LB1]